MNVVVHSMVNVINQAIVISDPDTEISAAAMDVHVGYFSDPGKHDLSLYLFSKRLFCSTGPADTVLL